MAEQIEIVDAIRKLVDSRLYEVNTSLPATIVSYANGKANVLPTPKRRFSDGDVLDFPIIQNVRVCWPSFSGGTAGVKGAIKAGDKCLLIFAQQATDGTDDTRRFDLSDAYAIMCDLGNVGGDSGNNEDLTMYFGSAYIRLTPSGKLMINAPAGVEVQTTANINMKAPSGFAVDSGSVGTSFTGQITASGLNLNTHRHSDPQGGTVSTPIA